MESAVVARRRATAAHARRAHSLRRTPARRAAQARTATPRMRRSARRAKEANSRQLLARASALCRQRAPQGGARQALRMRRPIAPAQHACRARSAAVRTRRSAPSARWARTRRWLGRRRATHAQRGRGASRLLARRAPARRPTVRCAHQGASARRRAPARAPCARAVRSWVLRATAAAAPVRECVFRAAWARTRAR